MTNYFSGLVNSVKGFLGYENLEVEPGGSGEEKENNAASEDRQSLWKQLSQYIGKDVTSMISLPVWIFEPMSFLQIMCEPMQFAELLFRASESPDSINRMAYLIAFITAGYSCAVRNKKPFNPLLGETFEYISEDNKWRFFAEQVSHHPPIGVAEAFSDGFRLRLEMEIKTKFRGNSSDVIVLGTNGFTASKYKDSFVWGHLETCAHNVIIGGMWVDHYGNLEIVNETTGEKGVLKFTRSGWLGAGRFDLLGELKDAQGELRMKLVGKWNEYINAIKVNKDGTEGQPILLWRRSTKPPENKWGFSKFVENLNNFDEQYKAILPPTDSRFRGDRYYLERDNLELAGKEKLRLEEKQRAERKEREEKEKTWVPRYFQKEEDPKFDHRWTYTGKYWEEREQRAKEPKEGLLNNSNENNSSPTPSSPSPPVTELPQQATPTSNEGDQQSTETVTAAVASLQITPGEESTGDSNPNQP